MRGERTILIAITLAMALAAPAAAGMPRQMPPGEQPGGMGGGMMGGRMERGMHQERMGRMRSHEGPLITIMLAHSQELGLSPEQEKKLRDLRTEFSKESVRRSADVRVAQIELDSLLEQEQWDLAKIEPKVKQIASLQADLRVARLKTLAAGRAVLTPQQLEMLKQVGHRMGPMGGPRGMGHGHREPGMMGPGPSPAPGPRGPAGPPAQPRQQ